MTLTTEQIEELADAEYGSPTTLKLDAGRLVRCSVALSHGRGTPEFDEFRQCVRDLLTWGFKGVTLELCDGTDAYGRPVVVDVASLWGIDSLENGYLAQVISELALELLPVGGEA